MCQLRYVAVCTTCLLCGGFAGVVIQCAVLRFAAFCTAHLSVYVKLNTVYDILPSTTAVFSYAIGSRKLSANDQFFVGAQTVVSLLQTTQIISDVCFITDHVAYASSDETKIV